MERRRTVRLLAEKALVALGRPDGLLVGAGWPLLDISEGGLRFAVPTDHPRPPKVGEKVVVTVEFAPRAGGDGKDGTGKNGTEKNGTEKNGTERAGRRESLQFQAEVRRVADPDERDVREVSLEFADLGQKDRELLRGTVLDLAMGKIARHREELAGAVAPEDERPEGNRLGEVLVAQDAITGEELERFMREDYQTGTPIGRQLVRDGLVEEAEVARALAEQAGVPYVDLEMEGIDLLRIRQFTEGYVAQHLFLPLETETSGTTVASANPLPAEVLENVQKQLGSSVRNVIASEHQIMSALQKAFHISRNQRRSARFPAGLTLKYKFYDERWRPLQDDVLSGLTKNLSDTGVLFLGPLAPGMDSAPSAEDVTHIGVHLFLPNQPEPVRVPCRLVRATLVRSADAEPDAGSLCLYAVKVLGISDEDRRRLNLFRLQSCLPREVRELDG